MLLPQDYAALTDGITGRRFDIQWQPALIGRPTAEADHNLMLAVNVELLPKGMTISRRHAQITFSDDKYYIEPLAENNPVFVNGKEMPVGAMWEIKNGDQITFGRYEVILGFTCLPHSSSPAQEVKSQPTPSAKPTPAPQPAAQVPQPAKSPVQQPPAQVHAAQPSAGMESPGTVLDMGAVKHSFLIVEKATLPTEVGQKIDMVAYPFVIGRTLPALSVEKGVSRQHAEINYDPATQKFTFKDLNSTNGSNIEGTAVQAGVAYEIKNGLHLGLGNDVIVRFES
jgi:pSer/pThr/pTyr-binding forkhead associated (FHA) protein